MENLINWFEIPAKDFSSAVSFGTNVSDTMVQGEDYNPSTDGVIDCLNGGNDMQTVLDKVENNNGKVIVPKRQISPLEWDISECSLIPKETKWQFTQTSKTMKTLVTSISLMLFTIFSLNCLSAKPASVFENTKWLLGTWEMKTSRGSIYETWVLKDSFEMSGKSYTIKGSDTLVIETVRITEKNGKILYIPSVSDQNDGDAVIFESSFISRSKFIVENPEHDFPQVISYTRTGLDELVAEISGPSGNGQVNYQTFSMKRMPDVVSRNIELVQDVFRFFNEHNWEQMASLYANPSEFKDPAFGIETVMCITNLLSIHLFFYKLRCKS